MKREGLERNMIDLHTHVLPQMDDGSRDLQMSRQMMETLFQQGVGVACATPHFCAEKECIESFLQRRKTALKKVQESVKITGFSLVCGAEVSYYKNISEEPMLDQLCYEGTKSLLLEMPFSEWNRYQVEEVIALVLDRNYHVVLAHPERFLFSEHNEKYLRKLAEIPISLQINAGALLRFRTRKQALSLLEMTGSPVIGSDCHNITSRMPNLEKAGKLIANRMGETFFTHMESCAEEIIKDAVEVRLYE